MVTSSWLPFLTSLREHNARPHALEIRSGKTIYHRSLRLCDILIVLVCTGFIVYTLSQ